MNTTSPVKRINFMEILYQKEEKEGKKGKRRRRKRSR